MELAGIDVLLRRRVAVGILLRLCVRLCVTQLGGGLRVTLLGLSVLLRIYLSIVIVLLSLRILGLLGILAVRLDSMSILHRRIGSGQPLHGVAYLVGNIHYMLLAGRRRRFGLRADCAAGGLEFG